MNCIVYDKDDNMIGVFAMYQNLKEIMDMDVVVDTSISIIDLELTVGLFWELTYSRTEEKERLVKEALESKNEVTEY